MRRYQWRIVSPFGPQCFKFMNHASLNMYSILQTYHPVYSVHKLFSYWGFHSYAHLRDEFLYHAQNVKYYESLFAHRSSTKPNTHWICEVQDFPQYLLYLGQSYTMWIKSACSFWHLEQIESPSRSTLCKNSVVW